jgi:hypothetical protein
MAMAQHISIPGTTSRNKLVIRRLPPTLPEDIFWKSIEPWLSDDKCLWKRYIKGRTGEKYVMLNQLGTR